MIYQISGTLGTSSCTAPILGDDRWHNYSNDNKTKFNWIN